MTTETYTPQAIKIPEDSFDLRKSLGKLLKYWYLFLAFPLFTIFAAYAYLRYSTPIYEVKASILIKADEKTGVGADKLAEQLIGQSLLPPSEVIDETKILKSRTLMREVMDSLDLYHRIHHIGRIRDVDLYKSGPFVLDSFLVDEQFAEGRRNFDFEIELIDTFSYRLTIEEDELNGRFGKWLDCPFGKLILSFQDVGPTHRWATEDAPGSTYLLTINRSPDAVGAYLGNFSVDYEEDSYVLELIMKDAIPQRGVDVVNQLIDSYNRAAIEAENEIGKNTLTFIDERLLILTDELSSVERNVENYKNREGITIDASSDLEFLMQRVGDYDKELTKLEIQKSVLAYLQEYMEQEDNEYELIPSNLDIGNAFLAQLVVELNTKLQERRRLLMTVTTDFLPFTVIDESIASLRFNIQENVKNIQRDVEIAIQQIKARSGDYEAMLRKTPRKERELLEIKRQQFIKENLYLFLLQKREETAVSLAATTPNARIIDRPELINRFPISPNKRPIFLGALLLGLVIPTGIVAMFKLLRNTIDSEEDIRSLTQMPILGKMGIAKGQRKIVVSEGSHSAPAEMFRLLRTYTQFLIPAGKHQTLLITSSISQEGKTFVAVNLGISFALAGNKVLLMDLDLRKPKMTAYLNDNIPPPVEGISNFLIGKATKEDVIQGHSEFRNLSYIASGPIPPNPSELISNGKLTKLIEELQQEYDVILIDTPPVGLVTDSLLFKDSVNASLCLVRSAYTKRDQVAALNQLYVEKKLVNPAIIFNGVKYSGNYGYGYQYGYYKEER